MVSISRRTTGLMEFLDSRPAFLVCTVFCEHLYIELPNPNRREGRVSHATTTRGSVTLEQTVAAIVSEGPSGPEALIPLLQAVQRALGYIPEQAIVAISKRTGVSTSEVFGTLTFYAQFRLRPQGRIVIQACRGTACHVRGGVSILNMLQRVLGIRPGETTPDGEYTLETVACVGACALAPTVVINDEVHAHMTPAKIEEMFGAHRGGNHD